jgi:hypothetical protein
MRCSHDRTAASCEQCVHAAARAEQRRAAATRKELYPFPNGSAPTTAFLAEKSGLASGETRSEGSTPRSRARRRS